MVSRAPTIAWLLAILVPLGGWVILITGGAGPHAHALDATFRRRRQRTPVRGFVGLL
jgi:hypothetical protein